MPFGRRKVEFWRGCPMPETTGEVRVSRIVMIPAPIVVLFDGGTDFEWGRHHAWPRMFARIRVPDFPLGRLQYD